MPRGRVAATRCKAEAANSHRRGSSLVQGDFPVGGLLRRVLQAGIDVSRLQIGEILQDLLAAHPAGHQFQHLTDGDAHAPDTGASATNF